MYKLFSVWNYLRVQIYLFLLFFVCWGAWITRIIQNYFKEWINQLAQWLQIVRAQMQYLGLGILGVIFREIRQISIFFRFTLNIFSYNSRGFCQIKQNVVQDLVNFSGDKIPIICNQENFILKDILVYLIVFGDECYLQKPFLVQNAAFTKKNQ